MNTQIYITSSSMSEMSVIEMLLLIKKKILQMNNITRQKFIIQVSFISNRVVLGMRLALLFLLKVYNSNVVIFKGF